MKKEIADKWVQALKSNKYSQTKGTLKDSYGYCCLGVLCEISKISDWKLIDNHHISKYKYNDSSMIGLLPEEVRKWADIKTTDGTFIQNNKQLILTTLNDDGVSFNEIADIIEKNWESI